MLHGHEHYTVLARLVCVLIRAILVCGVRVACVWRALCTPGTVIVAAFVAAIVAPIVVVTYCCGCHFHRRNQWGSYSAVGVSRGNALFLPWLSEGGHKIIGNQDFQDPRRVLLALPLLRLFSYIKPIRPLFYGLLSILPNYIGIIGLFLVVIYV